MHTYGVIFHPKFPPETLSDYARRAEGGGFDELWLWDDSFLPGALTSAAIALSATNRLKVGIGLMPATVYNPLFTAMEITTLARAFPGRILPGFGHGVGSWMDQIGAAPKSSMKALEETVTSIRQLLNGELVTIHGSQINLDQVQLQLTPGYVPPLYFGWRDVWVMGRSCLRCLRRLMCVGRKSLSRSVWLEVRVSVIELWSIFL
jgi:5,10-methylenetetrahydromethanopterin reductase